MKLLWRAIRENDRMGANSGSTPGDRLRYAKTTLPTSPTLDEFIRRIPKAELHIHIEGSLEPELMFELASRNEIPLRQASVADLRRAYDFVDLQSFLSIYYE